MRTVETAFQARDACLPAGKDVSAAADRPGRWRAAAMSHREIPDLSLDDVAPEQLAFDLRSNDLESASPDRAGTDRPDLRCFIARFASTVQAADPPVQTNHPV